MRNVCILCPGVRLKVQIRFIGATPEMVASTRFGCHAAGSEIAQHQRGHARLLIPLSPRTRLACLMIFPGLWMDGTCTPCEMPGTAPKRASVS